MKTIFLFLSMMLTIAASGQEQVTIFRLNGSKIAADSLSHTIKNLMSKAGVTGLEIAVFNNRKPVFEKAFGLANTSTAALLKTTTNMYGASLSKTVFSVLIMKLVEEKVINLDTPLQHYLSHPVYEYEHKVWHEDYSSLKDDLRYQKITARMCLDHTTGFPNWRWFEPDEKLRIKFEPGSHYSYSGEGLTYLQVVLEKITNKSLEELAQQKLFKPLGMLSSSFKWQPAFEKDYASGHKTDGNTYPKDKDNAPRGASTLETTLGDYTKFISAILNQKLLKPASYNEIFTPQVRILTKTQFGEGSQEEGEWNDSIELSYGLGWGLLKSPYGWGAFKGGHGDGFQHYSIIFPDKGMGIIILSNSDNAEGIFKYLLEECIGDIYTPWQWENYIPYDQKK